MSTVEMLLKNSLLKKLLIPNPSIGFHNLNSTMKIKKILKLNKKSDSLGKEMMKPKNVSLELSIGSDSILTNMLVMP